MKVTVIQHLGGKVTQLEGAIVICEDALGNPISIGCELAPGGPYDLINIKEDNQAAFNRALRSLGIDKLVVAEALSTGSPPDGSRLLYTPPGT